jgi:hypothetical protein
VRQLLLLHASTRLASGDDNGTLVNIETDEGDIL